MTREEITATYRVQSAAADVQALARDIAVEQTVEVPEELFAGTRIEEEIVGKVLSIDPISDSEYQFEVKIAYNAALAAGQLPQLLNLVYGNISMKNPIQLVNLELPDSLLRKFRGPKFGVEGIRTLVGVYDRPLLSTVLKPRGTSDEQLAAIATEFALGGGEIVKDDHNLVDDSFDEFRKRVSLCQRAVDDANLQTSRRCLYFPYLSTPIDQLDRYLEFIVHEEITGILISPLLMGLDVVRSVSERYPLIIMTHPTFTGTYYRNDQHGIEIGLMMGTMLRLIGADISVFPNVGGRFKFTYEECESIARRLRSPLGHMRTGFPAPAGGMRFDNIPEMTSHFGADTVFLVGGALLKHGPTVRQSTVELLQSVRAHFRERLTQPAESLASACELPAVFERPKEIIEHLPFVSNFTWKGRHPSEYKSSNELPFKDVSRHELLERIGEESGFDLRYFEIGPGGYSSREKHVHTHAIIVARGKARLVINDKAYELQPFDIAHVPPLAVHQFLNESSDEPFGFFCIVDHDRDRPMAP